MQRRAHPFLLIIILKLKNPWREIFCEKFLPAKRETTWAYGAVPFLSDRAPGRGRPAARAALGRGRQPDERKGCARRPGALAAAARCARAVPQRAVPGCDDAQPRARAVRRRGAGVFAGRRHSVLGALCVGAIPGAPGRALPRMFCARGQAQPMRLV
jgi:hypothetical protein